MPDKGMSLVNWLGLDDSLRAATVRQWAERNAYGALLEPRWHRLAGDRMPRGRFLQDSPPTPTSTRPVGHGKDPRRFVRAGTHRHDPEASPCRMRRPTVELLQRLRETCEAA